MENLVTRGFQVGDIVKHFKYDLGSEEEKRANKYLYIIKDFAKHTETGETLVIYQALSMPPKTFARPADMFCSEVERDKYPNVTQKYRFEKFFD